MVAKSTITIPSSTADKLAELGHAMLELAHEMKGYEGIGDERTLPFRVPKLERPRHVAKGDEWFWSDEWQTGEREVNEQLTKGHYDVFESMEELITDLHQHV